MDGHMPDMDGFAVVERIREECTSAGLTIMMLTSDRQAADADRCRALGVSRSLIKPITPSDLLDAILHVLGTQQVAPVTADVPAPAPVPGVMSLRVLVAEDNTVNQMLARRLLEKMGHEAVVVANGREAVEAVARETFDVVFMDVQMPEMDGFAATAAIRELDAARGTPPLPIVALTARAMKGDLERCLAAGMDDYVPKPIRPLDLVRVLERVFAIRSSASEAAAPC
jgi:CheY-like chemotaxis protein